MGRNFFANSDDKISMGNISVERLLQGPCIREAVGVVGSLDNLRPKDIGYIEGEKDAHILDAATAIAARTGNRDRIDSLDEIRRVLKLHAPLVSCNYWDSLLFQKADAAIVATYGRLRGMSSEIHREMGLKTVTSPLAHFIRRLPIRGLSSWRGIGVFNTLDSDVARLLNETDHPRRDFTVLYPGTGQHYAYLQTIMNLADTGNIHSAKVIATELGFNHESMVDVFQQISQLGIISDLHTGDPVRYEDGGAERTLMFRYAAATGYSVPITILLAENRSGEAFFRDEYLKQSDLVIIHDPGDSEESASYRLLAELLVAKRRADPTRPQLVVMEGDKSFRNHCPDPSRKPRLGKPITEHRSPYGHCLGMNGMGEFYNCAYQSAYVYRLDELLTRSALSDAADITQMFLRLFYEKRL